MGGTFYRAEEREARADRSGYHTKTREELFSSHLHPSMNPRDVTLREARDSEAHPCAFPIILGMDVTASMRQTPHYFIKTGLPHLMTQLIAAGLQDAAVCLLAITDHISNRTPLQIGQFESGDAELDMWLERMYLEGGGGGNGGESYLLALAFAAFVCKTDHYEKRGKPGVIITLGDEPPHLILPTSAAVDIFGEQAREWWEGDSITAAQLMDILKDRWVVCHVNVQHDGNMDYGVRDGRWAALLGDERVISAPTEECPKALVKLAVGIAMAQGSLCEVSHVPVPDPSIAEDLTASDTDHAPARAPLAQGTPSGSDQEGSDSAAKTEVETI